MPHARLANAEERNKWANTAAGDSELKNLYSLHRNKNHILHIYMPETQSLKPCMVADARLLSSLFSMRDSFIGAIPISPALHISLHIPTQPGT